jgi:proline iminopeptidase
VPHADVHGQSAYVSDLVLRDLAHSADVRPLLASNATPALVPRGECDFVPLQETLAYRQTLPNSRLVFVPGAGHSLWATRADAVRARISAFLLDQPIPDDQR